MVGWGISNTKVKMIGLKKKKEKTRIPVLETGSHHWGTH